MNDWNDRSQRLHDFVQICDPVDDFPLLCGFRIDNHLFHALELAVSGYLLASLRETCGAIDIPYVQENSIAGYPGEALLRLPNRTPNGVVLPQRENALWFNLIHSAVVDILESFRAGLRTSFVHMPLIVRLVDGTPDQAVDGRPYATAKLHLDAWNGEPPSVFSMFLPVLGDVICTGVEFFETPRQHLSPLVRQFADYEHGAVQIDKSLITQYEVTWNTGMLYVVDPLLLHKTMKKGGGIRVSVDFRLMPAQFLPSDIPVSGSEGVSNWKRNFISWDKWRKIGKTALAAPRGTFAETKARKEAFLKHGTPIPPIDYSSYFEMISIE